MAKFIFVTGGVVSSIGKGICVASIGRILKSRNITVSLQKLDPYLNVDPGTMSPYQHGEVFVTEDGCETDLDLGHYERFIDVNLGQLSNVTAGQIYSEVIARERRGDFLGGTIQTVPHVTNEIKSRMLALAEHSAADVVVVEVGGTVGDIEGLPFLEAIRQMRNQVGRDNVFYIHLTLLPHISTTGELKTKPTQHSVKELRGIGIQPDALVCRSDFSITEETRDKLSTFCDVQKEAVIALPTVPSIYEVPLLLEDAGLGELLVRHLDLPQSEPGLVTWRSMVDRLKEPKEVIPIAVVGKYAELPDSYLSVKEALHHAALFHDLAVEISWVRAEAIEEDGVEAHLGSAQGIVVPGGFGPRGIKGMRQAVRYAHDRGVPYFGLCLGMQVMVVEFASLALGSPNANSTEFDPETSDPVIDLMSEQRTVQNMGGTMRLGVYPCDLVQGSLAARAYNADNVWERHRHRFEFNNRYRESLGEAGLLASGLSPDGQLVEITELRDHPFMVGVQFHPEFLSRPDAPHPLFRDFIGVAKETIREGGQHPLPMNGAAHDR